MASNATFAEVAALAGDPARAGMLHALMDGRALTASELARIAGVTPQTASSHLARLTVAGLLAAIPRPFLLILGALALLVVVAVLMWNRSAAVPAAFAAANTSGAGMPSAGRLPSIASPTAFAINTGGTRSVSRCCWRGAWLRPASPSFRPIWGE